MPDEVRVNEDRGIIEVPVKVKIFHDKEQALHWLEAH
jgi:hypothetical protein